MHIHLTDELKSNLNEQTQHSGTTPDESATSAQAHLFKTEFDALKLSTIVISVCMLIAICAHIANLGIDYWWVLAIGTLGIANNWWCLFICHSSKSINTGINQLATGNILGMLGVIWSTGGLDSELLPLIISIPVFLALFSSKQRLKMGVYFILANLATMEMFTIFGYIDNDYTANNTPSFERIAHIVSVIEAGAITLAVGLVFVQRQKNATLLIHQEEEARKASLMQRANLMSTLDQIMSVAKLSITSVDAQGHPILHPLGFLPPKPIAEALRSNLTEEALTEALQAKGLKPSLIVNNDSSLAISTSQNTRLFKNNAVLEVVDTEQRTWSLQTVNLATQGRALICTDVSELKRAQSTLQHQRRMDSLGVLSAGISHEFNNLLMITLCAIDQMEEETSAEKVEQHRIQARFGIEQSATLVRRLLNFSRKQEQKLTRVECKEVLNRLIQTTPHVIGQSYPLQLLGDCKEAVLVEAELLETTLLNLINNAADAMPDGGNINIKTEIATQTTINNLNLNLAVSYLAITVSDEGTGIDENIADRVFEPFYSTKAAGKGVGLGLAMAYGFAQRSGGGIYYTNKQTQGTNVTLLLPIDEQSSIAAKPPLPQAPATLPSITILVVEDEPMLANMITNYLNTKGAQATCCYLVSDAITQLDKENSHYDIVISDLRLPDGTGLDIAEKVSTKYPHCKIILISGNWVELHNDTQYQHFSKHCTILNKPFKLQELHQAVANHFS